jgi:hypothetical protein
MDELGLLRNLFHQVLGAIPHQISFKAFELKPANIGRTVPSHPSKSSMEVEEHQLLGATAPTSVFEGSFV